MSIATDEAARRWPDSQALQQPSMDDMYGAWSREAFVLGAAWQRGREPTDAEVRAAKIAVCAALCEKYNPARMVIKDGAHLRSIDADNRIAELSDGTRIQVERLARIVLDAVREAVMS